MTIDCGHSTGMTRDCGHSTGVDQRVLGHSTGNAQRLANIVQEMNQRLRT
ncbi:unnamed protein product [Staurois parvus]|uniref:Uncharacterized protein n=1 Tax=Staurois parvus TaxID=386267 RepID=A0ABN9CAY7_9NEOB|nr:unnamed protein product [Staurois parvus]